MTGGADEADDLRSGPLELSAAAVDPAAAVATSDSLRSNTLLALMNCDSKLGTVDGEFFVLPYFSIYRIVILLLRLIFTARIEGF